MNNVPLLVVSCLFICFLADTLLSRLLCHFIGWLLGCCRSWQKYLRIVKHDWGVTLSVKIIKCPEGNIFHAVNTEASKIV